MYLLFEYLSYAGLFLIAAGAIWFVYQLIRGRWRKSGLPMLVLLVGAVVFAFPMAYTRLGVDLGPHEQIVDSERHLTLTGWDRTDYDLLAQKRDTVVLQMANPDVTDDTLHFVSGMSQLRELDLNDTQITDRGIALLGQLRALKTLKLRGTAITDQGFHDHLMSHPGLLQLDLRQTAVAPESIVQWTSAKSGRRVLQ